MEKRPGLMGQAWQRSLIRPEVCAIENDGCRAPIQLDFTVACNQTGRMDAVQTLCVSWEVREQIGAPPQKDGQLITRARVSVSRAVVCAHTGKLHVSEGTLGLENPTVPCVHWPLAPAAYWGHHNKPQAKRHSQPEKEKDTALKHSSTLKGIVHPKMKILSLITRPHEYKIILVASLSYGWTTDVSWTIMFLVPFWALIAVYGGSESSQKYLNLCFEDERRSYRFGMTWVFIFGWTIPLNCCNVVKENSSIYSGL